MSKPQVSLGRRMLLFGGLGVLVVAVILVLVAAFNPSSGIGWLVGRQPGAEKAQKPVSEGATVGIAVGQKAPDFTVASIDGSPVHLSDFQGKPTILYFSTPSCLPCIPETKVMAQLKAQYGAKLAVIWIDVALTDKEEDLREYGRKYGHPEFVYALDKPANEAALRYQIKETGILYLLNAQQVIVFEGLQPTGSQAFQEAVRQLVQ